MFNRAVRIVVVLMLGLASLALGGCAFNTHGNRKDGPRLLTRIAEVRGMTGKRVTLDGTARTGDAAGASIELRGGRVELPGYVWPSEFVDRPVSITGRLLKPETVDQKRVYRLGEIERSAQWSR